MSQNLFFRCRYERAVKGVKNRNSFYGTNSLEFERETFPKWPTG